MGHLTSFIKVLLVSFPLNYLCLRENVDQASDEHEYEKEILAELVELEVEQEEDYQRKLLEYKKQLEEWKLWRKKKVCVRVRVCV